MANKILLVEDSKEVYRMVEQSCGLLAELTWADTAEKAKAEFAKGTFDLILLDIELPDGNGVELCSSFQLASPHTPIFFLTSKTGLSEKVMGFSAGAEDYITKPFEILELKARIEAKLRKQEFQKTSSSQLKWKEIEIDKSKQEVKIQGDDGCEVIELTALEFKLLTYFADRPEEVIPRDQILDDIWGKEVHVYSRSVDTHISKLRKKLGPVSEIVASVHGTGYKFSPNDA